MNKILDNLLQKLDRKLSEERRDNPNEDMLVGVFTFGRHIVRYVFTKKSGCELEIWNPVLDCFLDNVAFYCEPRTIKWDESDTGMSLSEYQVNGFSDEADYLRYKFG